MYTSVTGHGPLRLKRAFVSSLLGVACLLGSGCATQAPTVPTIASDPVCGAVVNPDKAIRINYAGRTYYFDSEPCATEFWAHAAAYTGVHSRHVGPR